MLEFSENEELEEEEKYNKRQYQNRFGISYFSRSSKGLNLNFHEVITRKNSKFKSSNLFSREKSKSIVKENSFGTKNPKSMFNEINEIDLKRVYDKIETIKENFLPISNFFKIS